jgi:hypothetical protein
MFQHENNLKSIPTENIGIANIVSTEASLTPGTPFTITANANRKKVTIYVKEGDLNIFINNLFVLNIGQYHFREIGSDLARLTMRFESQESLATIVQYS